MDQDIRESILEAFPIIEEIEDSTLREKIVNAWIRAIKESSFNAIAEIPFSGSVPGIKLMDHIQWVLKVALYMASLVENGMNSSINRDLLIAAVLLHDLGKAYEYRKEGNQLVKTDIGKRFIHGFWGTYVSLEEGISQELAHLIATHANESPLHPQLIEGIILHYADFAHADILRFRKGLATFVSMKGKG